MSLIGNRTRLAALTKELLVHWDQTKDSWRDSRAREFETRHLNELASMMGRALSSMEKLDEVLAKMRSDCE